MLGYTAPVQKCMVFETTKSEAVATPTDKRGFVLPRFRGLVRLHCPAMVLGWDGQRGNPRRTASDVCFNIPAHPERLKPQKVALVSPEGAKTMTPTPGAQAAPTPTQSDQQAFADAINCASMARWYLKRGNLPAARRKAVQALAAMQQLQQLEG